MLGWKEKGLYVQKCGRRYPIKDDIPVMLIDEAELPEELKRKING